MSNNTFVRNILEDIFDLGETDLLLGIHVQKPDTWTPQNSYKLSVSINQVVEGDVNHIKVDRF